MATVKELKATARPQSGKGAARAERRAGRVPGVIYGNNQPPVTISVDDAELRQRILAGRFLTTIYDIDLEGKKHRVIPRDFHLDPVRDFPLHVDFMRLGEGATIRVSVPLHIQNAEAAPGVKRGGTVNIVTHTIDLECSVDNIPQYIEADVGALEISHSLHLSDIKLPAGVKSLSREDATLVTIVPPSGYAEEHEGCGCGCRGCRSGCCGCAGCSGAAPAAGAPALLRACGRCGWVRRCSAECEGAGGRRQGACRRWRQEEVSGARDAASCASLLVSAIPARNTRITGTISASWPSMKSRGVMVSHHGAAAFRARPSEGTLDRETGRPAPARDLHERVRGARCRKPRTSSSSAPARSPCFRTNSNCRRRKVRVKIGGGIAGHNGLRSISAHIGNEYRRVRLGIGHPGVKELVHSHVLSDFAKSDRPWVEALCEAIADNAGLLGDGSRLDVPEQGASGAAGQGIFRQGR